MAATVLVAEDDRDLREMFAQLLGSAGYEVVAVGDGQAARQAVRERRFDLVVTDVWMPRVSGLDLCRELREDPETEQLPVLLLSAYGNLRTREEAKLVGATDYVSKPIMPNAFLARVAAMIQKP
jgi:DNA-binding response OmpR family regulator